jgi:hypothetical protein
MENFRHNQLVFETEYLCMLYQFFQSWDWTHEQTCDGAHIKHKWCKSARRGNKTGQQMQKEGWKKAKLCCGHWQNSHTVTTSISVSSRVHSIFTSNYLANPFNQLLALTAFASNKKFGLLNTGMEMNKQMTEGRLQTYWCSPPTGIIHNFSMQEWKKRRMDEEEEVEVWTLLWWTVHTFQWCDTVMSICQDEYSAIIKRYNSYIWASYLSVRPFVLMLAIHFNSIYCETYLEIVFRPYLPKYETRNFPYSSYEKWNVTL